MNLRMNPSPSYHDATPAPAPAWVTDAVPGVKPLLASFDEAKAAHKAARAAQSAAIVAFRDASGVDPKSGDPVPLPRFAVDEWRQLQAVQAEAAVAAQRSVHPIKRTYQALRSHLLESPEALAAAEAEVDARHTAALDALVRLDEALAAFAVADAVVPDRYARREGLTRRSLSADLQKLARDIRETIEPPKAWTYTATGTSTSTAKVGG